MTILRPLILLGSAAALVSVCYAQVSSSHTLDRFQFAELADKLLALSLISDDAGAVCPRHASSTLNSGRAY